MTPADIGIIIALVFSFSAAMCFGLYNAIWLKRTNTRISEMEKKRKKLYDSLADPKTIEEQMEKGARLREMKDANRTTLPRDDAVGQNAKVFRPKMRSKLPTRWNPPRA